MTQALVSPAPRQVASDELVIKCANLSKVFKDFWMRNRVRAVDSINLDVRRGEVFGLLGPNGSGKSTTIKMILGLLNPSAGRIFVFGKRPEDVRTKEQIGYLPEESYLYRFLNPRETLEFYGRLFYQDRHQRKRRIDMLLEMVGLEGAQRRPVGEFSKGMQRRIGLAQALINDPQLLILDEPTSGLDPIGSKQVKDIIVQLAERGKTILLCSHLLSDVEDVCDRVAIMFGGKVRAYGTCDELLVQGGQTILQTPDLSPEVIQQVEMLLARHGSHIQRVDKPRQKLEDLFLDIVHKAQSEGAATSGARAGGKIAQFLVDGDSQQQAQNIIDSLIAKPAEPTPAPAPAPVANVTPSAPAADVQVITDLTAPKAAPTAKPPAPIAGPASPANQPAVQPDLSVLNDLIKPSDPTKP